MIYHVYSTETGEYIGTTNDAERLGVDATTLAPDPDLIQNMTTAFWDGVAWFSGPRPEAFAAQRAAVIAAVQAHIDAPARAWGYDDIYTAVGYADEPADPQFQAEGQALRRWRSLTWRRCWDVAASVASVEELLALLPAPPSRPEVA